MESDHLQWRKWFMEEKGESADLPRNFKDVSFFNKLLLLRALRGDRITSGLTLYIRDVLGDRFIDQAPLKMDVVYSESSKQTPIFFVLFPGVDPTVEVEKIGA
mmetsp:Transcript_26740/g.4788  ORF Transcript_26740/g.4788 Transcript_26740/m.4788 type:complete len:103 (+) Transcript_26740:7464-7772(+)